MIPASEAFVSHFFTINNCAFCLTILQGLFFSPKNIQMCKSARIMCVVLSPLLKSPISRVPNFEKLFQKLNKDQIKKIIVHKTLFLLFCSYADYFLCVIFQWVSSSGITMFSATIFVATKLFPNGFSRYMLSHYITSLKFKHFICTVRVFRITSYSPSFYFYRISHCKVEKR